MTILKVLTFPLKFKMEQRKIKYRGLVTNAEFSVFVMVSIVQWVALLKFSEFLPKREAHSPLRCPLSVSFCFFSLDCDG